MFNLNLNLGESIPNITDIIQAFCALVVMICTVLMVYIAYKALHSWRLQDKHNSYLRLIENFNKLKSFIGTINLGSYQLLINPNKRAEIDLLNGGSLKSVIIDWYGLFEFFDFNKILIEDISKHSSISLLHINEEDPLRKLFLELNSKIQNIQMFRESYSTLLNATVLEQEYIDGKKEPPQAVSIKDRQLTIKLTIDMVSAQLNKFRDLETINELISICEKHISEYSNKNNNDFFFITTQ